MGISSLTGLDHLRIEPGNIEFDTIGGDSVDRPIVNASVEIVSPIYGNTYFRKSNPSGSAFQPISIELVGSEASFIALSALCTGSTMTDITLVIGGSTITRKELCGGVLTSVSYQNNIIYPDKCTGNIGLIILP